jgi:hypothetical protein
LFAVQIQVMTDWHVTDIAGSDLVSPSVEPTDGALVITSDRTSALNHDVYWLAPKEYIGNKVYLPMIDFDDDISAC